MKIGFLGMGNMAQAVVGGILKKGICAPLDIIASRRSQIELDKMKEKYGIIVTTDNVEVVKTSDIIILAVKPQMLKQVTTQIKEFVKEGQIIVSLAAGKTIGWFEEELGSNCKIVRCMPNTPALVLEGCTGVCYNSMVTEDEIKQILTILSSFGKAELVSEHMMDAVVGVSGSSPAYVFMMIEAMADGAVAAGMPRKQAYEFAAQAIYGSAKLVMESGKHPGELKDMVCSPGGTTIAAVKALEEGGFRASIMNAVAASVEKSRSL